MSIACDVLPLWTLCERMRAVLAERLVWPESDFHRKLTSGLPLGELDGHIALVADSGTLIGWARSEPWTDGTGWSWPTLEAFVVPERRRCGVASFATAGLVVAVFAEEGYGCAVFSPPMLVVASKAGLHPTLFQRDGAEWRRYSE